jgi:hypothetical protein
VNVNNELKAAAEPLTVESLRTLGVEVGKPYKTNLGKVLSVTHKLDVWIALETEDGIVMGGLCKLTSLAQARSLLVGLGVSSKGANQ